VLVRGFKTLSGPKIPHAASASRSDPLLQRPSGPRDTRLLVQDGCPVTPVTAGRPWLLLPRTNPTTIASRRPPPLDGALAIDLEQVSLPQMRFRVPDGDANPRYPTLI